MSYEEVKAKLDEKIPRDVVALRDAGRGMKLSYLEGWYVIARLNEVFGNLNWEYTIDKLTPVFSGEVEQKFGPVHTVSYLARVRLTVPNFKSRAGKEDYYTSTTAEYVDVGYGDGSDKKNPGKAHELAAKEAVTDALKRCAKNLGYSMGLALYDKTQEYVDDERTSTGNGSNSGSIERNNNGVGPTGDGVGRLLESTVRVAISKKLFNGEAGFLANLKEVYGVSSLGELSESQKKDLLAKLQANL